MPVSAEITVDQDWGTLPEPWPSLFEWVERTAGARLVGWRRQARWRPAWYLTVDDPNQPELYVRCQREESMPWTRTLSLRREYEIMRVLHEHGAVVPKPLGFCEHPEAILMESVRGRDRFDDTDDAATRDIVITGYMDALAHAHRIDPAAFEAIGLHRPTTAREIGYMGFELSEKWYRSIKPGPDPTIEFIIGWLHRNVPTHRDTVSWIHFDAGQFLHHDRRVTALMDVEFSCLGDPLADLGAMRMRDTAQPIGDLTTAYAHYAKITGTPVDRRVVNFHAVRFALLTAMLSAGTRADPPAEFDLAQWQAWSLMSLMICLTIISEESGYQLDVPPPLSYPAIRHDPGFRSAARVLDSVLTELDPDDYLAFRLRIVRDLLPGLHRAARAGDHAEELDRAEEARLLGEQAASWQEAEDRLERYVTGEHHDEAEIVRLLARRLCRQIDITAPGMRDVRGFRVQPIDWSRIPGGDGDQ
ncbi:phosphotransferase [Mycolicibacterium thermoresistibile]|uniref:Aminoglycoside phosphotransferase domain-containing protein n=2 Tax=Mycolicibacterium thermoresistibile TaxID=1797 RepID=G7CE54_MYCT3|nr:phosphotransferase [Mycolicibacterium thermoresistibile]EHI13735.1 putative protein kinase [Mycolicibacterium thermoresistibile ATCC 19527]MCV7186697.1 phosphotransferase [Mycolicibacterium thermoresistibile]GAT17718.1 putative uncharacterized protein [Mycolicibacterium thermoresistibile]SNW16639.1 putative aminoglycoside phosphotransferase [Mycolicibacterium thermoresistibile]